MNKFGTLLLAFIGAFSIASASEEQENKYANDSFLYGELGTSIPTGQEGLLPVFGLGFRGQSGHNGFDINAKGTVFGDLQTVKGSLSYLYYLKPNLQGQFYAGLGAGLKQTFDRTAIAQENQDRLTLSPELTFGKQYITNGGGRRFFQAQITPFEVTKANSDFKKEEIAFHEGLNHNWTPSVTVSYGWGF
ncbi:MAG: hypothetical protein ChlgKO_04820 [Chlamydiales bacterium]